MQPDALGSRAQNSVRSCTFLLLGKEIATYSDQVTKDTTSELESCPAVACEMPLWLVRERKSANQRWYLAPVWLVRHTRVAYERPPLEPGNSPWRQIFVRILTLQVAREEAATESEKVLKDNTAAR
jgi:hypothetical protein